MAERVDPMDENKKDESVETVVHKVEEPRVKRKRVLLMVDRLSMDPMPLEEEHVAPIVKKVSKSRAKRVVFWDENEEELPVVKKVRKPRVKRVASMAEKNEDEAVVIVEKVKKPRVKKEPFNIERAFEEEYAKYKALYLRLFWKREHASMQEMFPEGAAKSHLHLNPFMVKFFDYLVTKNTNVSTLAEVQPRTEEVQDLLESLSNFMCLRPVDFPLAQRIEIETMHCFYFLFLFSCYTFFEYPDVAKVLDRYDDECLFDYPSSDWTIEGEEGSWESSDSSYASVDPLTTVWRFGELRRLSLETAAQSMDEGEGSFFGEAKALAYFLGNPLAYETERDNSIIKDFQEACAYEEVNDDSEGNLYVYEYKPEPSEGVASNDKFLPGASLQGEVKSTKKAVWSGRVNEFNLNKKEIKKIALESVKPMEESAWYENVGVTHPLYIRVSEQDLRSAHAHKLPSDEEFKRIQHLKMLEERGGNDWYDDEFVRREEGLWCSEEGEEAEDDNLNSYYGYSETEPDKEYFDKRRKDFKRIQESDGKRGFGYKSTVHLQTEDLDEDDDINATSSFDYEDDDPWVAQKIRARERKEEISALKKDKEPALVDANERGQDSTGEGAFKRNSKKRKKP